jgi:hypothetical protein
VDALVTGLIGVAATLLGSFTTYLFQSRAAEQAQAFEWGERRRQEQADACAAFAAALTELKRGLITLWFSRRDDPDGDAARAARMECDRLGAAAETARFRVQLACGDAELMDLAEAAIAAVGGDAISGTPGRAELRTAEEQFEAAVKAFISAASARLQVSSLRPKQQRG